MNKQLYSAVHLPHGSADGQPAIVDKNGTVICLFMEDSQHNRKLCDLFSASEFLLEACRACSRAMRGGASKDKDYTYELGLLKNAIDQAHGLNRSDR